MCHPPLFNQDYLCRRGTARTGGAQVSLSAKNAINHLFNVLVLGKTCIPIVPPKQKTREKAPIIIAIIQTCVPPDTFPPSDV